MYFLLVMFYFSQFLRYELEEYDEWRQQLEFYMSWPFWVLLIYQFIGEGVRLSQGKFENLSIFALIDSASLGINTFIFLNITLKLKLVSLVWLRTLGCYGIILIYSKTFYWLRMWPTYALSVRVIKDVTYDMKEFLVLLFGVVALFGNAIYVLDLGRRGEPNELFQGIEYEDPWH